MFLCTDIKSFQMAKNENDVTLSLSISDIQ